jgi:hypothetical protein
LKSRADVGLPGLSVLGFLHILLRWLGNFSLVEDAGSAMPPSSSGGRSRAKIGCEICGRFLSRTTVPDGPFPKEKRGSNNQITYG